MYNHAQPAPPSTNRPRILGYPQRLCQGVDRALSASGRPARALGRDTGLAAVGGAAWETSQPPEVADQAPHREPIARLGLAPLWPLPADPELCRVGADRTGSARASCATGLPRTRREPRPLVGEA